MLEFVLLPYLLAAKLTPGVMKGSRAEDLVFCGAPELHPNSLGSGKAAPAPTLQVGKVRQGWVWGSGSPHAAAPPSPAEPRAAAPAGDIPGDIP